MLFDIGVSTAGASFAGPADPFALAARLHVQAVGVVHVPTLAAHHPQDKTKMRIDSTY